MSTTIECCFRGCRQAIWREAVSGFEVNCSSATCLGCRKMVLCVEHFEEVFAAQKGIACANCGESAYWVYLFEPARLSPALAQCVQGNGGDVEFRYAASAVSATAGRAERMPQGHIASRPSADWHMEPPAPSLNDGRNLAPGIAAMDSLRGTQMTIDDQPDGPLVPGKINHFSISATGERFAVEFEPFGGRSALVQWFRRDGGTGTLIVPEGVSLRLGGFIDERRLGVVAHGQLPNAELREVTLETPSRARSRRIFALEKGSDPLLPPIPMQNREAVVLTQGTEQGAKTVVVRLADSHASHIVDHAASEGIPKALAAASRASAIAWIDAQGRIRAVAGPGQAARILGETSYDVLAVAPSGGEVAWLEAEDIVIADLRSGQITRKAHQGTEGVLRWSTQAD